MEPLSQEAALDLLTEGMVGHLGVISGGEPYVTPTSYVVDGSRILFRTQTGRKLDAIEENPKVCLEVARFDEENGNWQSVIVTGIAKEATDRETGERTVQMLFDKYRKMLGSPLDRGGLQLLPGWPRVMVIEIETISGMTSRDGFSSRTRPGRL